MQGNGRYSRFETTMWGDISVGGSVTTPTTSGNVIFSGDNNFITNGTYNTIVGGKDGVISATGTSNSILCGVGNQILGTCSSCSITGGNTNTINNCTASHVTAGTDNFVLADNACASGDNNLIDAEAINGIANGEGCLVRNRSEWQLSNGFFANQGDAHVSHFILRNKTASGLPQLLYLDYPTNTKEIYISTGAVAKLRVTWLACIQGGAESQVIAEERLLAQASPGAGTLLPSSASGGGVFIGALCLSAASTAVAGNTISIGYTAWDATSRHFMAHVEMVYLRYLF